MKWMLLSLGVWLMTLPLAAADKPVEPRASELQARVDAMLAREAHESVDRRAALRETLSKASTPAELHWQAGQVKWNDKWVNAEDVPTLAPSSRLAEYLERRDKMEPTTKQHFELAGWCRKAALPQQEQAHIFAAMYCDPSLASPTNLKRAGYVQQGGRWISPDEQQAVADYLATCRRSMQRWHARLESIRDRLVRSDTERARAQAELAIIDDPSVLPAVDFIIASAGAVGLETAIDFFAKFDEFESSQLLAKYAVFSNDPIARSRAARALMGREFEHFIPDMLGVLATEFEPTAIRTEIFFGPLRFVRYGWQFKRETQQQIQVANFETRLWFDQIEDFIIEVRTIRRSNLSFIDIAKPNVNQRLTPTDKAILRSSVNADLRSMASIQLWFDRRLEMTNEQTRALNAACCNSLKTAVEVEHNSPEKWWAWWDSYLDVTRPQKNVVEVLEVENKTAQTPAKRFSVRQTFISCFRAGTLVHTARGLEPIEELHIGDLVLAQDVETGELAYKPVMLKTRREKRPLVCVTMGDEDIVGTSGHPFWKSGTGWIKSRDLELGDLVRSVQASESVTRTQPNVATDETYNLIVADFHTYFVGQAGVLVHDVTPTAPTNAVIPGLSKFELSKLAKPATPMNSENVGSTASTMP